MERQRYPTDVTDAEWAILEPLVPPVKPGGRPRQVDLREVFNAIFYLLRGGIPWRMLPHDFPPWKTVYHYFRLWRLDGTWEKLNARLREQVRSQSGREATPSAGVMDSQSARTTERGDPVATMGARR
jgi:putative transposase